ncbi:MAG: PEP-CTERM sorting domain-containing protein, partial [Pirellulales bacterium]
EVTASPDAPFVVELIGLDAAGEAGPLANFDPRGDYAWLIASADEVAGFDPSLVAIDASQFLAHDSVPSGGRFELRVDGGSDLLLVYRVPEPGTLALLAAALASVVCLGGAAGLPGWHRWLAQQ